MAPCNAAVAGTIQSLRVDWKFSLYLVYLMICIKTFLNQDDFANMIHVAAATTFLSN